MFSTDIIYEVVTFSVGDTKAGTKMGKLQLKNPEDNSLLNCILWEETLNRMESKIFRSGNKLKIISGSFNEKFKCSHIKVYCIDNKFFGEKVTVAGLITGRDLINGLKEQGFNSEKLLLPSVMFKGPDELIFLDDIAVTDVETELNTHVVITNTDAVSLFDSFLNN